MRVATAVRSVTMAPEEIVAVDQARLGGWRGVANLPGLPLVLGALQVVVAVALVLVELAQPAPDDAFGGIAFSNAIASSRARAATELFRERLNWPHDAEDAEALALSPGGYLAAKRTGVAALALLQAAALLACFHRVRSATARSVWPWMVGPGLSLIVLALAPPVSTDVFYYAAAGNLAADGVNPYLSPPAAVVAGEAFAPFNDWAHISTPYGPVWTILSRLVIAVTGTDPFRAALGLKLLAAGSAVGLALVTPALARRLTDRPEVVGAAVVLVAWQPVLLLESAGAAHLDATMMLLAVGGLAAIASGKWGTVRAGLALIAVGALVKPIAAALLPLAALWRVVEGTRRAEPFGSIARRLLGDGAVIGAVIALTLAPFWSGGDLLRRLTTESRRLYLDEPLGVNAFWFWLLPRLPLVPSGDTWLAVTDDVVRPGTALVTLGTLTVIWCWLVNRAWPSSGHRRPVPMSDGRPALRDQVVALAAATIVLGLLPVNAHAWYAIWPLAPVALAWAATRPSPTIEEVSTGHALRASRPWTDVPWWLWLFLIWSTASFLVYHTHALAPVAAT